MGVQHPQVSRPRWRVSRLDHQVSAHILVGQRVGQPCQIVVVFHSRRALADVGVHEKRGAVARREDRLAVAHGHVPFRIAGMDGELRRRRLQGLHHLVFAEIDPVAVGLEAMFLKDSDGFVVGELDADVGQQLHGGLVDQLYVVTREKLVPVTKHFSHSCGKVGKTSPA